MLLTAICSLFLTLWLKPIDASEIRQKLLELTTVPDIEIFTMESPDLSRCIHFCVSNKYCTKMLYQNSDFQCRGYGFGSKQTTEPLNEGQVAMDVKGARDCGDVLERGATQSGEYGIHVAGKPQQVYCDMDTDGGGWTVFLMRKDGSVSFNREWEDYKRGFGDLEGEFWAGNELMHLMTYARSYSLRVDMTTYTGDSKYAVYQTFSVAAETDKFRLLVAGYSGNAGDSLVEQENGSMFSTVLEDNDTIDPDSCAVMYRTAWWFGGCHRSLLTGEYGEYPTVPENEGISWHTAWDIQGFIRYAEMKMRVN